MSRDALIVGINTYQNLPRLKAPASDAEAIAKRLEKDGDFQVIQRFPEIIQNGAPVVGQHTNLFLAGLQEALVKLFKPNGNQFPDTALFYFSGHGLRQDLGISTGYLATSDSNPNQNFFGLSLPWLRRLLEESPVRQQIIWLDCCHSGELLNFGEADPGDRGKGRDRCFIAASRAFEPAYEDLESEHSVLTRALLAGLDPNRCPNRWVDNLSLTDFINQTLRSEIQTPICNNSGEPINLTRSWQAPAIQPDVDVDLAECPYRGLSYFDCNDEDPKYFYGRTALTDQLLDQVRQSNFVAIVGASGSGKSSVLRAGLLHQLKLGRRIFGSEQWKIHIMTPGEHPLQNLALAFVDDNLSHLERADQQGKAEALIKKGADGLRQLVQSSGSERLVLVVDQFEEAFTLVRDETEREEFFACLLGALAETKKQLCIVLAMRADFVGKCLDRDYSGLADHLQQHMIAVKAMTAQEMEEAIIKPANQINLEVESELVKQILEDVEGSPGHLPLLQYTLTKLWEYRLLSNSLSLRTYQYLGGIKGTLESRATAVYEQFSAAEQTNVKYIFLALTQLGEGTEDTRRRILKQDLITAQHPETIVDTVVQRLADAKLIVTNEVIQKGVGARVATIDIAHESLIRNWSLLRNWIEQNRHQLREKHRIEAAAAEWRDRGGVRGYLLQGIPLSEAKRFQKEQAEHLPLSVLAAEFIKESLRNRCLNRLKIAGLLAILSVLPLSIGEYFWRESSIKRHSTNLSSANLIEIHRSILYLTQGCDKHRRFAGWLPLYFDKRLFGNCHPLDGTILRGVNLSSIDISGAYLDSANLRGGDFNGANLSKVNLIGANLSGANLSGANLSDADLSGANLRGSVFSGTNLRETVLNLANLSGANLSNANLSGANLSNANLSGANLFRANLLGSRSLTTQSLQASRLCNTKLPNNLALDPNRDCP